MGSGILKIDYFSKEPDSLSKHKDLSIGLA
jgi:hypothetical protein